MEEVGTCFPRETIGHLGRILLNATRREPDLTAFIPSEIPLRAAGAIVGVLLVRDGIYALRGKEMWVALRGRFLKLTGPVETRVFGLLFILIAMFLFFMSWTD